MKKILFLFLLSLLGCSAVKTEAGSSFYQKEYSVEHLKSHPKQRVRKILLSLEYFSKAKIKEIDRPGVIAGVDILVNYNFSNDWYEASAICHRQTNNSLQCNIDGDEGSFTVERTSTGIQLNVDHLFLLMCGKSETDIRDEKIKNGYDGIGSDDDQVFFLKPISDKEYKTIYLQQNCKWIP